MSISRTTAWLIWVVASIFYAYQYVLRVMPNVMLHDIFQQFHINTTLFGQYTGAYYIGYALMHVPIGLLLDRLGPRKVMTVCILLTVLGSLPLVFAEHWVYPLLGRIFIGAGSSAAILGAFKLIRMGFSEQYFTRMLSFSVTIGVLGAIYGGGALGYFCETMGDHAVIILFALFGLCLAGLTYILIPDIPPTNQQSIKADLLAVLSNYKVMTICLLSGLMVGPLEGFADVWGTSFLKTVYHLPEARANSLPSLIFIGMCMGGPLLSMLAEKSKQYWAVIIGAGSVMMLGFMAIILSQLPLSWLMFNFLLIGIACAYQILAIYKASTYVPEHQVGLTTAIANMVIMSFGYAFHTLISLVISQFGGPTKPLALAFGVGVIPTGLALAVIGYSVFLSLERYQINHEVTSSQPQR